MCIKLVIEISLCYDARSKKYQIMKNVFGNTKEIGITSLVRSFIDSKTFCIQYALGGEKLQR